MALKAGRRGLNKRLVDAFGNFNGEVPSGDYYTKQQTDNKFETKTHVNNTFQKKTLDVPIEMLSGSKLTVEDALQGLNTEKFTYADNGILGAKNLYSLNSTHIFVKSTARVFESNKLNCKQGDSINVSFDMSDVANFGGTQGLGVKFIDDSNVDVSDAYDYGKVAGHYKHTFTINKSPIGQIRAYMFLFQLEPNNDATLKLSNIMFYLGTDPDDTYVPYAMTNRELTEELTVQESAVTDIISGAEVGDLGNYLYKYGKVVTLTLRLNSVTATAFTRLFKIPTDYLPKKTLRILSAVNTALQPIQIQSDTGDVLTVTDLTNSVVLIHASWITD